eukprot:scaffold55069_cov20-Prasinocladus_malaysianus.AAC.1
MALYQTNRPTSIQKFVLSSSSYFERVQTDSARQELHQHDYYSPPGTIHLHQIGTMDCLFSPESMALHLLHVDDDRQFARAMLALIQ